MAPSTPAEMPKTLRFKGGKSVFRLGFGSMRITGKGVWGPPADADAAVALLRRAVERGVTFIDTADSYGPGSAEALIARALHPYPAELVIASKGGFTRPGPASWTVDARPERLRQCCEESLKRLKVEAIELYQLHVPDPRVPYEDSVGALVDLQRQGKIRHIGISNVSLDQLRRAQAAAAEIVSVQNAYNWRERGADPLVDACTADGIAFIPFYPLGKGKLSGPGTNGDGALARIAATHQTSQGDATSGQIALAWLLHRSPVMLPIPGTASAAHLDENIAAAAIRLSETEIAELG